jgi:hypothetical protein
MKSRLFFSRATSVFALVVIAVFFSACARSDAYRKDQEFYEDSGSGYYSQKPGQNSATDRLEKIKQPRKKVLVLGFWNDTPIGNDSLGAFGAEELRRALYLSRRVIFPEEKTVSAVTRDFVQGDRVQVAQLIREGRRVGVTSIVVGRISKIVFRQDREEVGILREAQNAVAVDIELKVFDVGSGREVHSVKRSGVATNSAKIAFNDDMSANQEARDDIAKDAIYDAVTKLVPDALTALDKMDWQGRIAKILGNKVYINAGRVSGILAGDILKVLSPGEEIVDPVTKAYLGRSEGMLKGTLEVSDFIGEDSSLTNIHTGGNFQEGDVVRLY